jgi:phenylpyruvate tautomerase PptA (4-oxalocrotonate tautomerase family)
MPIVRVDVPQGHSSSLLLTLKCRVEDSIARTWAKEHIYVAVKEMSAEPGDRTAIVTVDLRPGRGQEQQRAAALYQDVLAALKDCVDTDPERFVLLIREFPERNFVVSGGQSLPPLDQITPQLFRT